VEIRVPPQEAASALAWLASAGADVIVEDRPRNWLAAPVARAAPVIQAPPRADAPATTTPRPAPALPADITDLAGLQAALSAFSHPLRQPTAPQLLIGATDSRLLVLLDQPDPADAPASHLLTRMLAAIGLDATSCATGHLLPWSTPAGRPPRDEEITAFAPFLARALAIATPRLILAFGDRAANLGTHSDGKPGRGIASTRGKWLTLNAVPMIATFHPRQLLAQPELKRLAWADLQAFAAKVPK
jgi:DNA polymerase